MPRPSRLAPALLVPALLLTACGGSSDASDTAAPTTESSSSAPATSASPSGDSEPIPVGQTITDPVMGHEITVLNVVRNFPIAPDSPMADKELVLVEVAATAGTEFYAGLPTSSFALTEPGEDIPSSSTTAVADDMTAAGYTPYADVDSGESGTGWLAFFVYQPGATGLQLQYERQAAGVIGSGEQIQAEVFSVPLPDPAG